MRRWRARVASSSWVSPFARFEGSEVASVDVSSEVADVGEVGCVADGGEDADGDAEEGDVAADEDLGTTTTGTSHRKHLINSSTSTPLRSSHALSSGLYFAKRLSRFFTCCAATTSDYCK